MKIELRRGSPEDAAALGRIDFEAFKSVSIEHSFPWDFPSVEVATAAVGGMLANPGFYCVVAEADGKVVGSNFLDERNDLRCRSDLGQSGSTKPNYRTRLDARRDGPLRGARLRGMPPRAGRLPQSLVVPLYEARFRHPRTALQDVRAAAPRHACGIRSAPGERARSGGV